jgi:hypothetical protein
VNVEVVHETSEASVACWQQTVIFAVRTAFTDAGLASFVEATNARARDSPVCTLLLVGERTELPTPMLLHAVSHAMRSNRATCAARVVPGRGMWATAFRGMLNTAQLNTGEERVQAAFTAVRDAASWLAHTMNRDSTYRAQLATIAGTLVYGSPSWNRRSQIEPYLADDDDGTGQ